MSDTNNYKLTSLECSDFLNWTAYHKYGIALNKTQMQKLLYLWYGIYLARTEQRLFDDDSPKAWPFGPVFPRVNKRFVPSQIPPKESLPILKLSKDKEAFEVMRYVLEKYHSKSAFELSEWSHEESGPWYKTVYEQGEEAGGQTKWNKPIPDELIKTYFTNFNG